MSSSRALTRYALPGLLRFSTRPFSAYAPHLQDFSKQNSRGNDTREDYRKHETSRPLNPDLANTDSTIVGKLPKIGKNIPPPELISVVDGNTDAVKAGVKEGAEPGELGVGEMEGASFKVEPLRRIGEDANTMRARLLYQSRKRGTLESELLLSTFADSNLSKLTPAQLHQYDLFLDENDWDIYYWATQEPTPTSHETAEGGAPEMATENAAGKETKDVWKRAPASGEWAQTVGTFKPAYRPVPQRWRDSEILVMLRRHVEERSAGEGKPETEGKKGLGFMPEIKSFDQ